MYVAYPVQRSRVKYGTRGNMFDNSVAVILIEPYYLVMQALLIFIIEPTFKHVRVGVLQGHGQAMRIA
jgi:hypothetical protein